MKHFFVIFLMLAALLATSPVLFAQEEDTTKSEILQPTTPTDSNTVAIRGEEGVDYMILTNLSKEEGYFLFRKKFVQQYKAIPDFTAYRKNLPPLFMCNINKWKPEDGQPVLWKHKDSEEIYWAWDAGRPLDPDTYYSVCLLINSLAGQFLPQSAIEHGSANMKDIEVTENPDGSTNSNYRLKPRVFKGDIEDIFEPVK